MATFPAITATNDGDASSAFVSTMIAAGLQPGSLSQLGQVQLALANLLQTIPAIANVPAGDLLAGKFGTAKTGGADTGTYTFPGSALAVGAIGYAAGAGSVVTQVAATKSTSVTLNTVVGAITCSTSGILTEAEVTFSFVNNKIGLGDVPLFIHSSGGTSGAYMAYASNIAAGSCDVTIKNVTGGTLGEACVLTFFVLKGVTA